MKHLLRTILVFALILSAAFTAQAQTVYTPDLGNLSSDPSSTPWTYGVGTHLGATPVTPATRLALGGGDLLVMQESATYNGVVGINFGSITHQYPGYDVAPGAMFVHPQSNTSRIVKVRFTVPHTGVYTISASWEALNGRTSPIRSFVTARTATVVPTVTTTFPKVPDAKVLFKGNRKFDTSTPPQAATYSYSTTLNLQQGDELFFEVNAGNDWFNDGTQANIRIETSTPPPPSCDDTDRPSWDGSFAPQGPGTAYFPLQAPAGLTAVDLDLINSYNLALVEVRSADGTTVLPFTGSGLESTTGGCSSTSGFETLTFNGTPGEEPASVQLVVCAPIENEGSNFYMELSDTCPRTLRVDPVLELFGTSTDTEEADLPTVFALDGNYPNPFNPSTEISFALPEAAQVSLVVYDLMGRTVATLANGEAMTAGQHSVRFEAGDLPSGAYLYRLTAGSFTATRTMVLMK